MRVDWSSVESGARQCELDHDIATVLNEHACLPLDDEIEHLSSLLATCARRSRLQEAVPA